MNFHNDIAADQPLQGTARGLEGLLALACKNLIQSSADRDALRAFGVPDTVITSGLVGAMPAFFDGRHDMLRWTPDESAAPCVVVGIRDDTETPMVIDHPDPESVTRHGALIDIAAFRTGSPDTWAQYTHIATIAGRAAPQFMSPPPTLVSRHPLAWLKAGWRGITILSKQRNEIRDVILQLQGGIDTNGDRDLERELRRIADRPWPHARIAAHWSKEGA